MHSPHIPHLKFGATTSSEGVASLGKGLNLIKGLCWVKKVVVHVSSEARDVEENSEAKPEAVEARTFSQKRNRIAKFFAWMWKRTRKRETFIPEANTEVRNYLNF